MDDDDAERFVDVAAAEFMEDVRSRSSAEEFSGLLPDPRVLRGGTPIASAKLAVIGEKFVEDVRLLADDSSRIRPEPLSLTTLALLSWVLLVSAEEDFRLFFAIGFLLIVTDINHLPPLFGFLQRFFSIFDLLLRRFYLRPSRIFVPRGIRHGVCGLLHHCLRRLQHVRGRFHHRVGVI
mmetsp:Transcript_36000/g.75799  ORF Transcript_36000/g.75799 Transcript_36000/m.75799 type:complete len:179 (-) Transcript_36000:219-755(-)